MGNRSSEQEPDMVAAPSRLETAWRDAQQRVTNTHVDMSRAERAYKQARAKFDQAVVDRDRAWKVFQDDEAEQGR